MNKEILNKTEEKQFMKNYDDSKYPKPSVTADILIFRYTNKLQILMITRKNSPYIDCLAIPGGFMNIDESLEETALRELKEETHVEKVSLHQFHTFSKVDRDPRNRVISVAYYALINGDINIQADDDAKSIHWINVNELWNDNVILAFDHKDIIRTAINTIREKMEYSDLGKQLLPQNYSIEQVKSLYNEIFNEEHQILPQTLTKYEKTNIA